MHNDSVKMVAIIALLLLVAPCFAIWPLPVSQSFGDQVLWIDKSVNISYHGPSSGIYGYSASANNNTWTKKIIQNAIERTYDTLFEKNINAWKFNPRMSNFEPALSSNSTYIRSIRLQQNASDPSDIMKPAVGSVDESYSLTVTASGQVVISAVSSIGILYGLTTFTQLFFSGAQGQAYTKFAPVDIQDKPKFPWRGLNLDCSRTFKPVKEILATIDALSYNKMNRLHWHVTDAQSWPLEISSMPELADKGAYASFQKYSPKDVQTIQEYGALLGVELVVEIDQPGHTSAIAFAYPDLVAAFNAKPWTTYCLEPPCGTLKLNSTDVSDFLENLFNDLLPRLKPLTNYFHLGGDEVTANAYLLDDTVQSNKTSVLVPLLQKFMNRNQDQLKQYDITPLVWEEQLLDWNLTLPKNTIVQTWLSDTSVAETVKKGYQALAGAYQFWYLDCGYGQWVDFFPGADSREGWPYLDYCSPQHNWRWMYSLDPLQGVPDNLQHLVLGGETHIWSEQTDQVNLDQMVWPRACAAGEVLWSGAKDAAGQNRSQIEASPRIAEMRERLVARGIRAEAIQMPFCTQNGTQCVQPRGTA